MSTPRFFVNNQIGDSYLLEGEEHNHLAGSLRMRVGEAVVLCDNSGYEFLGTIQKIEKSRSLISITSKAFCAAESKVDLTLYQALIKNDKLDLIAQKFCELGGKTIVPFEAARSQTKKDSIKVDRLGRICLEAAKQCARATVATVSQPIGFEALVNRLSASKDIIIFANENEKKNDLKNLAQTLKSQKNIGAVSLVIGCEGGFTEAEALALQNIGAHSITLGRRILRAETAAIALTFAICAILDA